MLTRADLEKRLALRDKRIDELEAILGRFISRPQHDMLSYPALIEEARALLKGGDEAPPRIHDVDWQGVFRGTVGDPRETGWCSTCRRDVYDGDGKHWKGP